MNTFKIYNKVNKFSLLLSNGEIVHSNYGELIETGKPFVPYNQGKIVFNCTSCLENIIIDILENKNKALLTTNYINDEKIMNELGLNSDLTSKVNEEGNVFGYIYSNDFYSSYSELIFEKCKNCNQCYCILYNTIAEPGRCVDMTITHAIFSINISKEAAHNIINK